MHPKKDRADRAYEKLVKLANTRQDPVKYATLCDELGISENEKIQDFYEFGQAEIVMSKRQPYTFERYQAERNFMEAIREENKGILLTHDRKLSYTEDKIKFLKLLGSKYHHIKVRGNQVPIEKLSNKQINAMFKSAYFLAFQRAGFSYDLPLKSLGNALRRVRKDGVRKDDNLEEYLVERISIQSEGMSTSEWVRNDLRGLGLNSH